MDLTIGELSNQISNSSTELSKISIGKIVQLISLCNNLQDDILQAQNIRQSRNEVPLSLSPTINAFLSEATGISIDDVSMCWDVIKNIVFDWDKKGSTLSETASFEAYGWEKSLSKRSLFPPEHCCTTDGCDKLKPLTEVERRKVIFTTEGPVPAHSIHQKCRVTLEYKLMKEVMSRNRPTIAK